MAGITSRCNSVPSANGPRPGAALAAVHFLFIATAIVLLAAVVASCTAELRAQPASVKGPFLVLIAPSTPLLELLPTPPKQLPPVAPVVGDDPVSVPELAFQEDPDNLPLTPGRQQIGKTVSKILFLNEKEQDGFLRALIDSRPAAVFNSLRIRESISPQTGSNRRGVTTRFQEPHG